VSVDELLGQALATQDFVLLVGESASGKSRTALEAARVHFGDHKIIVPAKDHLGRDGLERLAALLEELYTDSDWGKPRAILWLDDLNHYLFSNALTPDVVTRLTGAQGWF